MVIWNSACSITVSYLAVDVCFRCLTLPLGRVAWFFPKCLILRMWTITIFCRSTSLVKCYGAVRAVYFESSSTDVRNFDQIVDVTLSQHLISAASCKGCNAFALNCYSKMATVMRSTYLTNLCECWRRWAGLCRLRCRKVQLRNSPLLLSTFMFVIRAAAANLKRFVIHCFIYWWLWFRITEEFMLWL